MKQISAILLAGTVLAGTSVAAVAADKKPMAKMMAMTMVKITEPANKMSVKAKGGKVTVKWNFTKAGTADHVHVVVDNGAPMPMPNKSSADLTLKPGPHTIKVVAATKQHKEIGPSDTVTVTVK